MEEKRILQSSQDLRTNAQKSQKDAEEKLLSAKKVLIEWQECSWYEVQDPFVSRTFFFNPILKHSRAARPPKTMPLPAKVAQRCGWSLHYDAKAGANYYHNSSTGQSRWDAPEEYTKAVNAITADMGGRPAVNINGVNLTGRAAATAPTSQMTMSTSTSNAAAPARDLRRAQAPIDRARKVKRVSYPSEEVMHSSLRRLFQRRYIGANMSWDTVQRNLRNDPVFDSIPLKTAQHYHALWRAGQREEALRAKVMQTVRANRLENPTTLDRVEYVLHREPEWSAVPSLRRDVILKELLKIRDSESPDKEVLFAALNTEFDRLLEAGAVHPDITTAHLKYHIQQQTTEPMLKQVSFPLLDEWCKSTMPIIKEREKFRHLLEKMWREKKFNAADHWKGVEASVATNPSFLALHREGKKRYLAVFEQVRDKMKRAVRDLHMLCKRKGLVEYTEDLEVFRAAIKVRAPNVSDIVVWDYWNTLGRRK
eukprot:gnl/Dysnectes_brevis/5270_a7505_304.p1 GENE.gnl/Dysnectes_brevis/5270_a7505_304~~gnl/Dysnectes_brevis/5270_a7505_304.p1  ORF type:complete len:564 (+),score=181.57 gnl/Dysnectes_brevis/5270_a7505_304:255-1694(+)